MFETIQLGEPVAHGGIAIAPLFPRATPRAAYLTLDEALPLGFEIGEIGDAGAVSELVVHNPLGTAVLLYDGEELVGAKQNRILNVTVLVAASSAVKIPVSCVEQGRWSWRSRRFSKGGHAYPELRRQKAAALAAEPLARGAAQGTVWSEIRDKSARLGVHSPTGAQSDIFDAHTRRLDELHGAFPLQPGQSGALVAIGGRVCLDWVSRPEAFARLYAKLLDGYLLDAVDSDASAPSADLSNFLGALASASAERTGSAGIGTDIRCTGKAVVGSGLEIDGELLQLSAFST